MHASVEVELDIFSGMPNPTWALTEVAADQFVEKLDALPRGEARDYQGNLGYRGFVVQLVQPGGVRSVRIQTGTVQVSSSGTSVYLRDAQRELERWLLLTGRSRVKDEVFQAVLHELP